MQANERAVPHKHDAAQRKALKCCHVCMNVAAHDAQCKVPPGGTCRVYSCLRNWEEE